MRIPFLLVLLDLVMVETDENEKASPFIQRRKRVMQGDRVSQMGSFSCFKLQWETSSKFSKVIDARLTYVEADHREIPVPRETRETLERSSIALPTSPVCINIHAENLKVEVVLYTIGNVESTLESDQRVVEPSTTALPAVVVTRRHWLERYEEILREADPERKFLKSPPLRSCELVTMEMPTIDLLPAGNQPTPSKFRQGICRGSCFADPISLRQRCCKPAKLEDLEAIRLHLSRRDEKIPADSTIPSDSLRFSLTPRRHVSSRAIVCTSTPGSLLLDLIH